MDKVALCGIDLSEWQSFGARVPPEARETLAVLEARVPLAVSRDRVQSLLREIEEHAVDDAFADDFDSAFVFFVGLLQHAADQEGGAAYFDIEDGEAPQTFAYILPGTDLRRDVIDLNEIIRAEDAAPAAQGRPWWRFW